MFTRVSHEVVHFCKMLEEQGMASGWSLCGGDIGTIDYDDGIPRNLFHHYGELTLENI